MLIVALCYDTRREIRTLRAEFRAGIQELRQDLRGDFRSLRTGIRADTRGLRPGFRANIQSLRADIRADSAHVRGDLAGLRRDIQALTVRMARIEGFLVGYFAARGPLDRHGQRLNDPDAIPGPSN